MEHRASSSSHDQASIQEDHTLMEETIVKKPHAGNSGAVEAASAAGAGAEAAAGIGAEAELSNTDVEQGKSPTKPSSPLKEKWTKSTHGLLAKAKQVTKRLYSPNKKCSKSKEGGELHSEGFPQK